MTAYFKHFNTSFAIIIKKKAHYVKLKNCLKAINKVKYMKGDFMRKLMIKCIDFYQKGISPRKPGKCRFIPTCSEYAKICYERFNFAYASFLTAKRILKCTPFHKCAYDPVPEKKEKKNN